tara:strand:- start:2561 stop:4000 length:1440 start_codon:yes stop_codon:yes gene_type:complete
MSITYNDPKGGTASGVGAQVRTDYYAKKALVEASKEQYFGQLADVTAMPKNMGKTIKRFHYMPILDSRNSNDQGLDAAGAVITTAQFYATFPRTVMEVTNATKAATATAINDNVGSVVVATAGANDSGASGTGFASITIAGGLNAKYADSTKKDAVVTAGVGASITQGGGNLYGSSKDVGAISSKIPALSEAGGRVNRVGMKRLELEGTIEKFGFFDEYTQESLDFDSDADLMQHITTESVKAANEITEDQLQIDLLNGAGVLRYAGTATSALTLSGKTGAITAVDYDDLVKLSIELNNNRTPKQTKVISGSRMVDTKVVNAARIMYVGSEMVPAIMKMTDYHSNKAFIPVAQYAEAGNVVRGEIGSVDSFRIVEVPEMMKWAGAGATRASATDAGYYHTNGNYDVFPMMVVGEGAFTTIGFQTDGKTVKFKIKHVRPSENYSSSDPYGETGFYSIKWYYGTMILRAERLAVLKTVALI